MVLISSDFPPYSDAHPYGAVKKGDLHTNLLVPSDGIEIKNRVTDGATNYDVRFPLISSKRLWSYGDAANTDVSTIAGAISYQELSPAVKVSKIFEAIETKYSVDFQGLFLTNKRFTNCFLECKNGDKPQADGEVRIVDWDELVTWEEDEFGVLPQFSNGSWSTPLNQISYGYHDFFSLDSEHILVLIISVMNASAIYTIDVYDNGVFSYAITDTGSKQFTIYNDLNSTSLNRNVKFTVRTDIITDVRFDLEYSVFGHFNAFSSALCLRAFSSSAADSGTNNAGRSGRSTTTGAMVSRLPAMKSTGRSTSPI
jgi:hypothetical protein